MKVISFYNIKGGVGKTTFAVNIAFEASKSGKKTLLWDLDPQGSATYILRLKPRLRGDLSQVAAGKSSLVKSTKETQWPLLDVLPSDFELRNLSSLLADHKRRSTRLSSTTKLFGADYDLVVVDCAPEASIVSENILNFSDLMVVPLIPNQLSINTFEMLLAFAKQVSNKGPKMVAAFNMVDRRRLLHKNLVDKYVNGNKKFLNQYIPSSASIEHIASKRAPLGSFDSRSLAAASFAALTREILELL